MKLDINDIVGKMFGKWTVLEYSNTEKTSHNHYKHLYKCQCACGTIKLVDRSSLIRGRSKSCGCSQLSEIIGNKYGSLTVLKVDHYKYRYYPNGAIRGRRTFYLCQCDCGKTKVVSRDYLIQSAHPSCGCIAKHNQDKARITHNLSSSRIYNIYYKILDRCNNPKSTCYENYGKRGISICNEWKADFVSFYNWAMKNGYKDDLTIDRIDNNGNYEPSNCRWVTQKQQQNNKRNNFLVTIYNRTQTLAEWCEERHLKYSTVCCRLNRGWLLERALTTPTS